MDILNYALQFERDGEAFYTESATKIKDKNLNSILYFLAAEERTHFQMIKELKTTLPAHPASIFISDVQNIFTRMKEKNEQFVVPKKTALDILEKALVIEDESIKYYDQKKNEVDNPKAKEVLEVLKKQEDAHYSLLSSIIEYYDQPQLWLENAEFNHIRDY
jgi:rubrerythrin